MNAKEITARLRGCTDEEIAAAITDEMTTDEQASQLSYSAPSVKRLGIPSYNWWNEGLHGLARSGTASVFPQAIGLAAMFDRALIERAADITSTEARAKYNAYQKHGDTDIYKGLTIWSPNINIFRDPRWGRGQETYGEDPFLAAELGKAYVRGLQGDKKRLKAAACAKHFAVHSGPEKLRHEFNAKVTPKELEETYLPAFEALITEARAEGVMGAYNRVNGEPSCASEFLQKKLGEWGFDGYFVSDCWAIRDFHENHKVTRNAVESAALAIKNGCDLNCGCTYANLLAALDEGLITKEDIRKACIHLMRTRVRLGMFDEKTEFDGIPFETVSCDEHKRAVLECAEKSMVLLKNNGVLPLDKSKIGTVAVIGPNAASKAALEGNYCGTADKYVTFLDGIDFDGRVIYAEGCHLYKDRTSNLAQADDRLAEAVAAAECADAVILCLGLDATIEGEEGDTGNEFSSGDKANLLLPECQRILAEKIIAVGKPVIAVCASGSALNLEFGEFGADAVIQAWYSGSEGGTALSRIIFGEVSPSGKLPVTFYESAELLPDFCDYSMKNRTYRYAENNVLYPFGFGLSYGDVVCTRLEYRDGTAFVTAENRGTECDDVIELYIKAYDENAVVNHSLCGFERVHLKKGESSKFEIPIPEKAFTTVSESGERRIFGTHFTLYAGTSQPDELSRRLTGKECLSVEIEKIV